MAKFRWLEECLLVSWGLFASVLVAFGWPVCRVGIHGTPKSICRHEMPQIQLDAYVSNRGESVKSDPGMMSPPRSVSVSR